MEKLGQILGRFLRLLMKAKAFHSLVHYNRKNWRHNQQYLCVLEQVFFSLVTLFDGGRRLHFTDVAAAARKKKGNLLVSHHLASS